MATLRSEFYNEIPLPFPNSSYLLEPFNSYSSPSSCQLGHMTIVYFIIFVGHQQYGRLWELGEVLSGFNLFFKILK